MESLNGVNAYLVVFHEPPPPSPRPPMQRMFKIWLSWPYVNLFLNISWRARKKKTTQWKINDNLVKHEIFEINICYEHTMYFKTRVHECNWFDNLKCTVYISFNCQIDGITDKSNIANKWKSKPRLCAVLLPIRLVTDWENMSGSSISWILVDCPYMYILSKLQSNHSKLLFSHFFL